MSQTELFTLPTCPCGTAPVIRDYHESPDVVLWCGCPVNVFNTPTEYEDWLSNHKGAASADKA